MYFATTIAERRSIGKKIHYRGDGRTYWGRKRKDGKRIQKNIRKEDILYKEEIANRTNCPVDNTPKRLTKI